MELILHSKIQAEKKKLINLCNSYNIPHEEVYKMFIRKESLPENIKEQMRLIANLQEVWNKGTIKKEEGEDRYKYLELIYKKISEYIQGIDDKDLAKVIDVYTKYKENGLKLEKVPDIYASAFSTLLQLIIAEEIYGTTETRISIRLNQETEFTPEPPPEAA